MGGGEPCRRFCLLTYLTHTTPHLYYHHQSARAILQFIERISVDDPAVGAVCGYARFDLARFGDALYGAPTSASKLMRSRQGKMEKSLLSFHANYPSWAPPPKAAAFLAELNQFQARQSTAMVGGGAGGTAGAVGAGLGAGAFTPGMLGTLNLGTAAGLMQPQVGGLGLPGWGIGSGGLGMGLGGSVAAAQPWLAQAQSQAQAQAQARTSNSAAAEAAGGEAAGKKRDSTDDEEAESPKEGAGTPVVAQPPASKATDGTPASPYVPWGRGAGAGAGAGPQLQQMEEQQQHQQQQLLASSGLLGMSSSLPSLVAAQQAVALSASVQLGGDPMAPLSAASLLLPLQTLHPSQQENRFFWLDRVRARGSFVWMDGG